MTVFHVQPGGYTALAIHPSRLGRTIRFVDGRYETSDPAEIAVLRKRADVTQDELAGDVYDPPVSSLSRNDLNEMASSMGVSEPAVLPNKQAVIDAMDAIDSGSSDADVSAD